MKTEKQHKTENQELKEWKKPELKVLDKRRTEGGGYDIEAEDNYYSSPN